MIHDLVSIVILHFSPFKDEVSTHLQWLQEVHKAHGDVEMNALELAASINARGVFIVGHSKENVTGKLVCGFEFLLIILEWVKRSNN